MSHFIVHLVVIICLKGGLCHTRTFHPVAGPWRDQAGIGACYVAAQPTIAELVAQGEEMPDVTITWRCEPQGEDA